MSGEIKAGDLVVVVATCCTDIDVGLIATVESIQYAAGRCADCRSLYQGWEATIRHFGQVLYKPISWLRRIDPLSEPETTQEEATA